MAVTSLGEFASAGSVAALSGSPNAAVPVGTVLVVGIASGAFSSSFTVTDTRGNTYTQVGTAGGSSGVLATAFLCVVGTALTTSDTITVDPAGSASVAFWVDKVTSVSGSLDGTAKTNTGSGTSVTSGNLTVAAGSTVYMVVTTATSHTFTAGGSFVSDHQFASTGTGPKSNLTEVLVGASAGTINPSMTLNSSASWSALAFSLAAATTTSAAGTAALSLTGQVIGSPATASASMTMSATADIGGPVAAAAIALSGSGNVTGTHTNATASLSLVGSSTITARITGTASITLTGRSSAGRSGPFVEADFTGTAFGGSPTWTDITAYVLDPDSDRGAEISGSWGRQDWFSQVSPSQFSLTLNNADGRFTPGLTSSPYYPYVKYGTRIRYREVIGNTFVFIVDGYITDLTVTPANGSYWTTSVDAVDILGRFATTAPLRSLLAEEMLADSPNALYTMQEPEGATAFADLTGNHPAAAIGHSGVGTGEVDAGESPAGNFVAGSLVGITNSDTYNPNPSLPQPGSYVQGAITPSNTYTVEMWVLVPAQLPGAVSSLISSNSPGGGAYFNLQLLAGAEFAATAVDTAGHTSIAESVANALPFDGNVHQVAASVNSVNSAVTVYVDGTAVAVGFAGAALSATIASPLAAGMFARNPTYGAIEPFTGAVAYLGYWTSVLPPARIAAHYQAGAFALQGESTDARISRLLSYRPNLGSILDSGTTAVGDGDPEGSDLQSALLDVTQTEAGALFADGQARINFRGRGRAVHPSPVLTLDASLGQVDVPSTFRDDIQAVLNDMTVTRSGGADQRYTDTSHANTYGYYSNSESVNIDSDADALALATFLVGLGTVDQLSIPTLTVDCFALLARGYTTLVAQILQLRPMDVVHLTNLPFPAPASTMNVAVQGGSFTRSASTFSVELNALPAPP